MYLLERSVIIPASRAEVFRFFEDPGNLALITPPWVGFRDLTEGCPPMRVGLRTRHRIRWLGVPLAWESRIVEYEPGVRFVDEQEKGPYHLWRHEHHFEDTDGGTLMRDNVQYALPFGILGAAAHPLVRWQLERIWKYREHKVREIFGG